PMMWQSAANMRFRILGGEAFVPGPNGLSTWHVVPPPDVAAVLLADRQTTPLVPSAELARRVRDFIVTYRVQAVLVDPQAKQAARVISVFTAALGRPPRSVGGMDIWLGALTAARDLAERGHSTRTG